MSSPDTQHLVEGRQQCCAGSKYARIYNGIGITLIVLGCVAAVIAVIAIAFESQAYHHGDVLSGIWGGIIFIVTGTISVNAARKQTCALVLIGVTTVASGISAGVGLAMFGIELANTVRIGNNAWYRYSNYAVIVVLVAHGILAFIGFSGMIISIVNTVYGSYALCRDNSVKFSVTENKNGTPAVQVARSHTCHNAHRNEAQQTNEEVDRNTTTIPPQGFQQDTPQIPPPAYEVVQNVPETDA
uniref:Uncharacterized protein n=1 Tax=Ciona savignyi TaxID=51511 RepID=H2YPJ4_CIOSA